MQRKDNESYLSYVRRVTEACSDKRITYSEWGDCVLGAENVYSSDNLRKAFYCVSKMSSLPSPCYAWGREIWRGQMTLSSQEYGEAESAHQVF